jgi:hypothetical protein
LNVTILTSLLNLLAPGRYQPLYFSFFALAETYVFVKQSPGPILCPHLITDGTPSPEVTGLDCRVP